VAVKGPPPLVHPCQNPGSIRDDYILQTRITQEAQLGCFVAAVKVESVSVVLPAPYPCHRLPGNGALRNSRPDASLATGPFTGGCQAQRGGGLLRACPKAKGAGGPRERGLLLFSEQKYLCVLQRHSIADFVPRATEKRSESRPGQNLWVVLILPGIRHLPQRPATGGRHARRRCRLAQVREDVSHDHRLGKAMIRIAPPRFGQSSGKAS
jgi:hypothetical protein